MKIWKKLSAIAMAGRIKTTENQRWSVFQIALVLIMVMMICMVCSPVSASSVKKVNITKNIMGFGYSTLKDMKKLKKQIGGMKIKKSKNFPTYYVKGNSMIIGVNENASPDDSGYVCIQNKGNKKVSILGVTIGMSKKKADAKFKQASLFAYKNNSYWWGDAAYIKVTYTKAKKVKSWKYVCAPTSY